jgi:hypothetical protein
MTLVAEAVELTSLIGRFPIGKREGLCRIMSEGLSMATLRTASEKYPELYGMVGIQEMRVIQRANIVVTYFCNA